MKRKIIYWLKYFKTKIFKWRLRHTKTLSIKGLYACYYIIDKYLTRTKPDDHNEEYEIPVTMTFKRMCEMNLFNKVGIKPNLVDAAFFTVGNFLLVAPNDMREKIYAYFNDWPYVDRLKLYIKSGALV